MFTVVECVSALVLCLLLLTLASSSNFIIQHVQICFGWVVRAGQGSVKTEGGHHRTLPHYTGTVPKLTQALMVTCVRARHTCCIHTNQINWTLGLTWAQATSVKSPLKDDNGRNYSDTTEFHFKNLKKKKIILKGT